MKKEQSHPIRNSVIATLIATALLALLAEFAPILKSFPGWFWNMCSRFFGVFADSYRVPGWLLLIFSISLIFLLSRLLTSLRAAAAPTSPYITDTIKGAVWRWQWLGGQISQLWCYCPTCDAELVYDDSSCGWASSHLGERKTDFICEHCHKAVRATVEGGDKDYATGFVKREIRRRMRVREQSLPGRPS